MGSIFSTYFVLGSALTDFHSLSQNKPMRQGLLNPFLWMMKLIFPMLCLKEKWRLYGGNKLFQIRQENIMAYLTGKEEGINNGYMFLEQWVHEIWPLDQQYSITWELRDVESLFQQVSHVILVPQCLRRLFSKLSGQEGKKDESGVVDRDQVS